jgi:hypothetical protein
MAGELLSTQLLLGQQTCMFQLPEVIEYLGNLLLEPILLLLGNGNSLWQFVQYGAGILVDTVDEKLVVEVRSGSAAGGAYVTDDIALSYS